MAIWSQLAIVLYRIADCMEPLGYLKPCALQKVWCVLWFWALKRSVGRHKHTDTHTHTNKHSSP